MPSRLAACLGFALLLAAAPAGAVERITLEIGRIESAALTARGLQLEWRPEARGAVLEIDLLEDLVPGGPVRLSARCSALGDGGDCTAGTLALRSARLGRMDARWSLRTQAADHWQLALTGLEGQLDYEGGDGRLAAQKLRLRGGVTLERRPQHWRLLLDLHADGGEAYVEPWFADLYADPLHFDAVLRLGRDDQVQIERLRLAQPRTGTLQLSGRIDRAAPRQRHALDLALRLEDAARASANLLQPLLAATRLAGTALAGRVEAQLRLEDGLPRRLQLDAAGASVELPAFGLALADVDAALHWSRDAGTPPSTLRWSGGRIGRVPVGAATLALDLHDRALALREPLRLPVLDGALVIERLQLAGLGTPDPAADFAAHLDPIDLSALCRALGWPEFAGTLSGNLPALALRERRLELGGGLRAEVFDGSVEVRRLTVLDPLGVLPRVAGELRLRRLDLAALTGAFDFGRITGRLDGDVRGLRLLGWMPVAMDAQIYTSPDDPGRRRISQRAIDSLSSLGGGPSGVLSRGFLRFFDDFAYARLGWRCVLDNGVCRMSGIEPTEDGRGFVLVEGRLLPRIDVIGYNRRVSWPVFVQQLGSVGAGPVEVR